MFCEHNTSTKEALSVVELGQKDTVYQQLRRLLHPGMLCSAHCSGIKPPLQKEAYCGKIFLKGFTVTLA